MKCCPVAAIDIGTCHLLTIANLVAHTEHRTAGVLALTATPPVSIGNVVDTGTVEVERCSEVTVSVRAPDHGNVRPL